MNLPEFNAAPEAEATQVLLACADVPSWAAALVAARPYGDTSTLTAKAAQLAAEWTDAEVDAALASHPRIGERRTQDDAAARLSRQEQAGLSDDEAVRAELRDANVAYEARFDRIFLIRAAGRDEREILAEARRRLSNDDATEAGEVAEQLRQIALLRLADAVSDDAAHASPTPAASPAVVSPGTSAERSTVTTHVLDAVSGTPAAGVTVTLAAGFATAPDVSATEVGVSDTSVSDTSVIATGVTDDDGRISRLGPSDLAPGTYTLTFATGDWFAARDVDSFYPCVTITFSLTPEREHVHVPILLSPFAFSTYRGS